MCKKWKYSAFYVLVVLCLSGCSKAPNDTAIADSVKAGLFSDPQLKTESIGINVNNGEVTLTGEVSSEAARQQVQSLVRGITGVKNVNDQLQVKPAVAAMPPLQAAPPPPAEVPKEPAPAPIAEAPKPIASGPKPPPPPPPPRKVTIPVGTEVRIQMIDSVNSDKNAVGKTFLASLQSPIVVDNEVVVPKGVDVYVALMDAKSAGKFKGSSELTLALDSMNVQGVRYPLRSTVFKESGASRGKQTAKRVGLGAAIGTGIGAIAGGGKGAAIGAGIGAGAGTAAQVFTKGKQVQVPSETKLDFTLEEPVQVTIRPKKSKVG
jgi:BON domain